MMCVFHLVKLGVAGWLRAKLCMPSCLFSQDGVPLGESSRWKFIDEEENHTLVIYEVQPEDAGQYACVAINSVGKSTCTARLDVESECGICRPFFNLWTTASMKVCVLERLSLSMLINRALNVSPPIV